MKAQIFSPVTYSKLTHEVARGGRGLKPSGTSSAKGTQNEDGCRELLRAVGRPRPFSKAVELLKEMNGGGARHFSFIRLCCISLGHSIGLELEV